MIAIHAAELLVKDLASSSLASLAAILALRFQVSHRRSFRAVWADVVAVFGEHKSIQNLEFDDELLLELSVNDGP